MKYKVISPEDITIGGTLRKSGETFVSENKSPHIQTALHFKQIELVSESPEADTKAADKAAAKAEAEAKAKAEADTKAK